MLKFTERDPDAPTVWMYWVDDPNGKSKPSYLDACLKSVVSNSECQVIVCDSHEARILLPELPSSFLRLIPPHQADLFRIGILSKFGGMYVDYDTFVLKSLLGLFELLKEYEFVGTDWYPQNKLSKDPLSISVLGPSRKQLAFLEKTFDQQLSLLERRSDMLLNSNRYPFRWEELLRDIVVPIFIKNRPYCFLKEGPKAWGSLAGGPMWGQLGDHGHMLMRMGDIGNRLPDSELFTICHASFPDEVRNASLEELKRQPTILADFVRMFE